MKRGVTMREQRFTRVEGEVRSGLTGAVIATLSAALNAFDGYTAEHSCETVTLAEQVAERLGVDEAEAETVTLTAALHDVGKIGVPPHVLRKPGPLTAEERSQMQRHPVIGERIVAEVAALANVASAIRHEHERWDGRGYPDGLAGEAIPLASRIVLACDAWHAMTSDRPYRRAMSRADAVGELVRCAGSQFDPAVTAALLDVVDAEAGVATAA